LRENLAKHGHIELGFFSDEPHIICSDH